MSVCLAHLRTTAGRLVRVPGNNHTCGNRVSRDAVHRIVDEALAGVELAARLAIDHEHVFTLDGAAAIDL